MPLVYTPIATDTFQRANESPLNPANWFQVNANSDVLAIVGNKCVTTNTHDADGGAQYIGAATPDDQYVQAQLVNFTANGLLYLYIRSGTLGNPGLYFAVQGPFNDNTQAAFDVYQSNDTGSDIVHFWIQGQPIVIQPNDVFRFGAQGGAGGSWYLLQNGVQIATGLLSDAPTVLTSGLTAMTLTDADLVQSDVGVINFEMGSVTGSPNPPVLGPSGIKLPFSKRTTIAVTIFACLFAARRAQFLTKDAITKSTLGLQHAELFRLYHKVRHQDVANQALVLADIIEDAATTISALNATVQAMPEPQPPTENFFALTDIQSTTQHAVQMMAFVALAE